MCNIMESDDDLSSCIKNNRFYIAPAQLSCRSYNKSDISLNDLQFVDFDDFISKFILNSVNDMKHIELRKTELKGALYYLSPHDLDIVFKILRYYSDLIAHKISNMTSSDESYDNSFDETSDYSSDESSDESLCDSLDGVKKSSIDYHLQFGDFDEFIDKFVHNSINNTEPIKECKKNLMEIFSDLEPIKIQFYINILHHYSDLIAYRFSDVHKAGESYKSIIQYKLGIIKNKSN